MTRVWVQNSATDVLDRDRMYAHGCGYEREFDVILRKRFCRAIRIGTVAWRQRSARQADSILRMGSAWDVETQRISGGCATQFFLGMSLIRGDLVVVILRSRRRRHSLTPECPVGDVSGMTIKQPPPANQAGGGRCFRVGSA